MNYAIRQILEEILGEPQKVTEETGQFRFDCPYCAENDPNVNLGQTDGKGNLEVNIEIENNTGGIGMYNCWKCGQTHGTHGSLAKLISRLGNKQHYARYLAELTQYEKDIILGKKNNYSLIKKEKTGLDEIKRYSEFKEFSKNNSSVIDYKQRKALTYLADRKIFLDTINKFKVRYCDTYEKKENQRSFYGRIIFPSINSDGEIDYFVARDYLDRSSKYKYQNPEFDKESIIFNEYFINYDQDIYLVEGVTDHIVVPNSIPMLGKNISDKLFITLQERAKANIIIFLDDDAFKDVIKLYIKLNIYKLKNKIRLININKMEGVDLDPSKINQLWGKRGINAYLKTQRRLLPEDLIKVF